jgi:hypothetical protein
MFFNSDDYSSFIRMDAQKVKLFEECLFFKTIQRLERSIISKQDILQHNWEHSSTKL